MLLDKNKIAYSNPFELRNILGNDVQIQDWIICQLPNDSFSIENAIILAKSNRWPLLIDP